MSSELRIFILAMTPILELNASIPVGLTSSIPLWKTFIISFMGNTFSVVWLLLLLGPISRLLSGRFKICRKFFLWIFSRTRAKILPGIKKYGKIGLVSFTAFPFPLTGSWTGAIASFIIGMPLRVSFPLISLGVLIRGAIISVLTISGITISKYFGWEVFLLIISIFVITYLFLRVKQRHVGPDSES